MRYPLLAGNDTGHLQFSWFAFGKERFPGDDVTLWCAAIDPVLDEHKYIVRG
jgi:hypothetical protein